MFIQKDQKVYLEIKDETGTVNFPRTFIGTWMEAKQAVIDACPEASLSDKKKEPTTYVNFRWFVNGKRTTKCITFYGISKEDLCGNLLKMY